MKSSVTMLRISLMITVPIVILTSYCRNAALPSDPLEEGAADLSYQVMVLCDHHTIPEVVQIQDIAAGHVCPGARVVNGKTCILDGGAAYFFDLETKQKMDRFDEIATCKRALSAPSNEVGSGSVSCQQSGNGWQLIRASDQTPVTSATYQADVCDRLAKSAGAKVVCTYFSGKEPLPSGGYVSEGWRPTNIETKVGLGRYAIKSIDECIASTKAANGDVVCTNTGIGWKVTHIANNNWCGSSTEQQFCLRSSQGVRDGDIACSYPADGMGHGNRWSRTKIFNCDYMESGLSLDRCLQR